MRFDLRQDLCHAVDIGLAADEARLRKRARFRHQMLAAAEADLEPDIGDAVLEQFCQIAGGAGRDVERKMRQQMIDQLGLVLPELVALAPTEEGALAVRAIGI